MAHIYRARLTSAPGMTKELVIKRVLPHLAENREFIDMFVDEARITMPLNHGNIVQVFEFGTEGKDYFLAMEYVRGRSLYGVLAMLHERGRAMPVPAALYIGCEIAKGLDYAHRFRDPDNRPSGIIHRDVSPQNVLVGFQGEVKLTDFGIAKARSRIHQTGQGIIRGKAVYLSPEQAECRDLDGRSDQFSLGSVLFEILTGVRPFEGENEVATLQNVRETRVQSPSRLRPEVPDAVDSAVLKALAREPASRFASCGDLQVALSHALHDLAGDFTSASLADWMGALFSDEMHRQVDDRDKHGHLRKQLEHLGGVEPTTGEMLEMSTVAIRPDGRTPARRFSWGWLLALFVVAASGLGAWLTWPWSIRGNGPQGIDAGLADAGDPAADAGADAGAVAASEPDAGPRPPRVRYGYLTLNSSPWALVEIDGRRLKKETPLFDVKVRAGKHRLRFFNPKLNIEKIEVVWVRHGQRKTVTVQLDAP